MSPQGISASAQARPRRLITVAAATGLATVIMASTAAAAGAATLYVSPKGRDRNPCTVTAKCKTIGHAVKRARAGDTIRVARGTYREDVTITKDITVIGARGAVVNAKGKGNGFLIKGPRASGALISGFTVENANFEGILAEQTSDVTIAHDTVMGNDLGSRATTLVGECAPTSGVPGDCGEGLHLMSVTHSNVVDDVVKANDGGILLTDEMGPTALNLIAHNQSLDNVDDCGITLAGHNTGAVNSTGAPQPQDAGVYENLVMDNTADGNGTAGQGGGILLASPAPGGAVYDNVVTGNTADGNGLAGVVLHSHSPGQDLDGNIITDNSLSADGTKGDPSFGVTQTQGILVASAVDALHGTVIAGNTISNEYYGIWTQNVPTISSTANTFSNVTVPMQQS